jgi:hypothetical protein
VYFDGGGLGNIVGFKLGGEGIISSVVGIEEGRVEGKMSSEEDRWASLVSGP